MSDINVLTHKRTNNFTIIPNHIIDADYLNIKSRFFLIWIFSKSSDWKITTNSISTVLGISRYQVGELSKELQSNKHLKIVRHKNNRHSTWHFFENQEDHTAFISHLNNEDEKNSSHLDNQDEKNSSHLDNQDLDSQDLDSQDALPRTDLLPRTRLSLSPDQKNGFAVFEEIPIDLVSDVIQGLKMRTFGKRFDDDWYDLTFEIFKASNDEKHELVPDNDQIKKRFKLYCLATGKNDQGSDYRYNNSAEKRKTHQEKQNDLWQEDFNQIPEPMLYILNNEDLLEQGLSIWNGYVSVKLNFGDDHYKGERLKSDFNEYLAKNKYRLVTKTNDSEQESRLNDLNWLDELNQERKSGDIL